MIEPGEMMLAGSSDVLVVNDFVRRQKWGSSFSYYNGPLSEVIRHAKARWGTEVKGYRDGVVAVSMSIEAGDEEVAEYWSNLRVLKEGDKLTGVYEARRPGEKPRKHVRTQGGKPMQALSVDLIFYRGDVLELNDGVRTEEAKRLEPDGKHVWELISINASPFPVEGVMPMDPMTLCANHFNLDGGTPTGMTDSEFVAALRDAVIFHQDKGQAEGDDDS